MGVIKRLLVPRKVRRAAHPVRTARRAVTPKPIKKIKRSVYVATNPVGALGNAAENAAVHALRPKQRGGKSRSTAGSGTSRHSGTKSESVRKSGVRSRQSSVSGEVRATRPFTSQVAYGWLAFLTGAMFVIGAASGWPVIVEGILVTASLATGVAMHGLPLTSAVV
jgi:hypothetical protein